MKRGLFGLIFILCVSLSARATSFEVGEKVAAKWSNNSWYLATIQSQSGINYNVSYADGDTGSVVETSIRKLTESPQLKAGEKVLAVWSGATFYPGTVQEVGLNNALIKWDDGSAPSRVEFGKILQEDKQFYWFLSPGKEVAAKWTDGNWYLATIESKSGNQFNVAYADGTSGTVTKNEIKSISKKPRLEVGEKVLAVWSGARFYSGTVQEVQNDGGIIKWDDGSEPSFVPYGKILTTKKNWWNF